MSLSLGFSPCPNDCFMFDAIVNQRIDLEGLDFSVRLADVEALNQAAFAGDADVTKLSYHAYAYCTGDYVLLDAGSALGRKCGPLLISKRAIAPEEVASGDLRIAIPGKFTTANFLLDLAFPSAQDKTPLLFSEIESALLEERFDAGLIIHEGQLTFQNQGLSLVVDLGVWWQEKTGLPLPLGGNVVRRDLGADTIRQISRLLKESIRYSLDHRDAALAYALQYARDMDKGLADRFVGMYVNDWTLDYGPRGREAVRRLLEEAHKAKVIPAPVSVEFVE